MDGDPAAVALKFGFLAVLYLFLFFVARSALKDLRRGNAGAVPSDGTGLHAAVAGGPIAATDAWLVVVKGGGLEPGDRIDLFGGVTIGRDATADVRITDRFASGLHLRILSRSNDYYAEDLDSTNGTYLNDGRLRGEQRLHDLDEVRIGDTEFRFELSVPGAG